MKFYFFGARDNSLVSFVFSLAPWKNFLSTVWLLCKFGFGFMKINRKALHDEGNGVFLLYEVEEGKSEPANKSKSGAISLILT